MDADPPLASAYRSLLESSGPAEDEEMEVEDCGLPVIDFSRLGGSAKEREECKKEMAAAAAEWGFFQVFNHGLPEEVFEGVRGVQLEAFRQPFTRKQRERVVGESSQSYRWGNPGAKSIKQLSWSEAYHFCTAPSSLPPQTDKIRSSVERYASLMEELAHKIGEILAEHLGYSASYFKEICSLNSCYLRLNRYPPRPDSPRVCGMISHTDSSFLTILHQDDVGGLQLRKGDKWVAVKPLPLSLVINVGDLLEAISNVELRSVKHRVVGNREVERFSMAFFLCPSLDTVIESKRKPSVYRSFSFREFQQQVQDDVKAGGDKVGLPRFLMSREHI